MKAKVALAGFTLFLVFSSLACQGKPGIEEAKKELWNKLKDEEGITGKIIGSTAGQGAIVALVLVLVGIIGVYWFKKNLR